MKQYQQVLLDTSAIVAIFQPQEQNHAICVRTLEAIRPPLTTTWPVITEAHYLLRRDREAQRKLLLLAGSDAVIVHPLDNQFPKWCERFSDRYRDHDVQIADASLVWLAEQFGTNLIFTLDRRDFSMFRIESKDGLEAFQILPESN